MINLFDKMVPQTVQTFQIMDKDEFQKLNFFSYDHNRRCINNKKLFQIMKNVLNKM